MSDMNRLRELRGFLANFRFRYTSEAELQRGIESSLGGTSFRVQREVPLYGLGRVDFMIDGNLIIETKIGGTAPALMRQVSQYAQSPKVSGILVITDRVGHVLPESFNGKPVLVHSLLDGAL